MGVNKEVTIAGMDKRVHPDNPIYSSKKFYEDGNYIPFMCSSGKERYYQDGECFGPSGCCPSQKDERCASLDLRKIVEAEQKEKKSLTVSE